MPLIRFESGSRGEDRERVQDAGSLGIEVTNAASGYKGGFTVYTCILDHAYSEGLQLRFVLQIFPFETSLQIFLQ